MHLEMKRVPNKDGVAITIYAEPITIIGIKDGYVWCKWEGSKWKMPLSHVYANIFDSGFDEDMTAAFLGRLNALLQKTEKDEE